MGGFATCGFAWRDCTRERIATAWIGVSIGLSSDLDLRIRESVPVRSRGYAGLNWGLRVRDVRSTCGSCFFCVMKKKHLPLTLPLEPRSCGSAGASNGIHQWGPQVIPSRHEYSQHAPILQLALNVSSPDGSSQS